MVKKLFSKLWGSDESTYDVKTLRVLDGITYCISSVYTGNDKADRFETVVGKTDTNGNIDINAISYLHTTCSITASKLLHKELVEMGDDKFRRRVNTNE